MNMQEFRKKIEAELQHPEWKLIYNQKEAVLRIEDTVTHKGVNLSLRPLLAKWEREDYQGVEESVRYVRVGLESMRKKLVLKGNESHIFPVIRAASFPEESSEGKKLVFHEHTAETRVYYALDLGDSYSLIDYSLLEDNDFTVESLRETALFNVRSLPQPFKQQEVAGNTFYFMNAKDGYEASRILDQSLIERMGQKVHGELGVAIPHQDALMFVDLVNDTGYDVMAQTALTFFGQGRVPVTALPFLMKDGELEPVFIMAQKKPKGPST
ncbi:DUF1444 family protein [Alkalicoccobacillus porphyridii]|uniref:DUF1444 family protein n=1 Tax=Alkalicoccobacillus porphyridii TaxID=2597270 RepID=A0A554A344_9BACI|nr:DUF1444 family protein [Alkalicoccobacillus porphyridii]TSB48095.1 DUF1444 family protein [Alkalicoccobacillus porphyridii]